MQLRLQRHTRKIKHPEPTREQSESWVKFLAKGNILLKYMTTNFNTMICEDTIKQFDIGKGILWYESDKIDEIKKTYGTDIQKELVQWIKNEGDVIFQPSMWKSTRDQDDPFAIFLGYRKIFQYKQYYFQLMVDNEDNDNIEESIFFGLALYGWKDETNENMELCNMLNLTDSYIIPEYLWNSDEYC
jgi:hypothetical protein